MYVLFIIDEVRVWGAGKTNDNRQLFMFDRLNTES
jgi:hypothetical protein